MGSSNDKGESILSAAFLVYFAILGGLMGYCVGNNRYDSMKVYSEELEWKMDEATELIDDAKDHLRESMDTNNGACAEDALNELENIDLEHD